MAPWCRNMKKWALNLKCVGMICVLLHFTQCILLVNILHYNRGLRESDDIQMLCAV
jgi:hypothetical protein